MIHLYTQSDLPSYIKVGQLMQVLLVLSLWEA